MCYATKITDNCWQCAGVGLQGSHVSQIESSGSSCLGLGGWGVKMLAKRETKKGCVAHDLLSDFCLNLFKAKERI